MAKPTSRHSATYHSGNTPTASDGRLFGPVFERNAPPLIAALVPWLGDCTGTVLEIGSGTGQHAGAFQLAFPNLTWQPSDPETSHRDSITAWQKHLRLPHIEPLAIDAATDWAPDLAPLGPLDAVFCMNVIHIAPYSVALGILAGASNCLKPGGNLIFYGPFAQNGRHNSPGNESFDAGLRAENPSWGIRDIDDLTRGAHAVNLSLQGVTDMPANNRLLVFGKS